MPEVVVRISRGTFGPQQYDEVTAKLTQGRPKLEPALRGLAGLRHYYVAIDPVSNTMVNVSVWDSLAHAQQMDRLAAMQAQRAAFETLGVRFEQIRNYTTLWGVKP
ncbi:MAG TPA: hypothetical protein VEU74_10375 [Gemmatimonadales bacterium]|nr:hypothetical protein [Gemmatimonadales bacterium]